MRRGAAIGVLLSALLLGSIANPLGAGAAGGDRPTPRAQRPTVSVPPRVSLGKLVGIEVSGFPAGARVRVQFARRHDPPCNCDGSLVIPRLSKPGFSLGRDGQRVLHVRMPRRYAHCTSNACPGPELTPFKSGQPIYVSVVSKSPEPAAALDTSRVR